MASRKYIILLLFPIIAVANPWIAEEGTWKYSLELSKSSKPKTYHQEYNKYIQIEKSIISLEKELHKIRTKISLLQGRTRNQENRNRLKIYEKHRIEEIAIFKKKLKDVEKYLYLDYKLGCLSHEFEYGYNIDTSFGIGGDFSKSKYSNSNRVKLFAKHKLYERESKILSIKPHLSIEEGRTIPGIDIIWGGSKKIKKLDSFGYSSLGVIPGPIYSYETAMGSWYNDFLFMFQAFGRIEKNPTKIYSHILRKQYKIAKKFSPEFTLSIGLFQDASISARRQLGSGVNIGIWGKI